MNSLLGSAMLWPAEALLNQLIRRDTHIQRQLAAFTGRNLGIHTRSPSMSLLVRLEADGLRLSTLDAATLGINEDASVRGAAAKLLRLPWQQADSRALADPEIEISGDVQLVQDLFLLMTRLDIDWEDYLAPLLGDRLTHGAGRAADRVEQVLRDSRTRLHRNLEDYLKEERRLVPHHLEHEAFVESLSQLRLQLDRAGARLDRLDARIDALGAD